MKVAIEAVPHLHLPACPQQEAALYRNTGLAIAVLVPTLFWTCVLGLAASGLDITIGAPVVMAFGTVIAGWCLVSAGLVMGNRS
jgi:hypothetical protein